MSNELPIHEVLASKYRDSREVRKRGVDEIILTSNSANTRIRIKSGQDWIDKHLLLLGRHSRTYNNKETYEGEQRSLHLAFSS
jgi:hypothetical protein